MDNKLNDVESSAVQGYSALKYEANQDIQHLMAYLKIVHAGWILALVMLLAGGGYLIHRQFVSYDLAMSKANDANKALVQDLKDTHEKWLNGQQQINAAKTQTIVLEKQVVANDTTAAAKVAEVTKPDATTEQVQLFAGSYLGEVPTITPDLKLSFKPTTVQSFIANKIELDNTKADLGLRISELDESHKMTGVYADNLKSTQDTLDQCTKTVADYKTVAVKSKWKRFGDTVKDIGIKAGIAAVSYEVGRHTK